jgi:hypothetical protein
MPGALDTKLRDKSYAAIQKYGKTVSWRSIVRDPNAYVPATGIQPETDVDYTIVVTPPFPYASKYSGGSVTQDVGGDLIKLGDALITIADKNLGFVPAVGDQVTIDADVWLVVGIEPIRSGEMICAWNARLRRTG